MNNPPKYVAPGSSATGLGTFTTKNLNAYTRPPPKLPGSNHKGPLVVLGTNKSDKSRGLKSVGVAAAPTPVPLNTPSLKRENNGKDIHAVLVPVGSASVWGSNASVSAPDNKSEDATGPGPTVVPSTQVPAKPAPWASRKPENEASHEPGDQPAASAAAQKLSGRMRSWVDDSEDEDEDEDEDGDKGAEFSAAVAVVNNDRDRDRGGVMDHQQSYASASQSRYGARGYGGDFADQSHGHPPPPGRYGAPSRSYYEERGGQQHQPQYQQSMEPRQYGQGAARRSDYRDRDVGVGAGAGTGTGGYRGFGAASGPGHGPHEKILPGGGDWRDRIGFGGSGLGPGPRANRYDGDPYSHSGAGAGAGAGGDGSSSVDPATAEKLAQDASRIEREQLEARKRRQQQQQQQPYPHSAGPIQSDHRVRPPPPHAYPTSQDSSSQFHAPPPPPPPPPPPSRPTAYGSQDGFRTESSVWARNKVATYEVGEKAQQQRFPSDAEFNADRPQVSSVVPRGSKPRADSHDAVFSEHASNLERPVPVQYSDQVELGRNETQTPKMLFDYKTGKMASSERPVPALQPLRKGPPSDSQKKPASREVEESQNWKRTRLPGEEGGGGGGVSAAAAPSVLIRLKQQGAEGQEAAYPSKFKERDRHGPDALLQKSARDAERSSRGPRTKGVLYFYAVGTNEIEQALTEEEKAQRSAALDAKKAKASLRDKLPDKPGGRREKGKKISEGGGAEAKVITDLSKKLDETAKVNTKRVTSIAPPAGNAWTSSASTLSTLGISYSQAPPDSEARLGSTSSMKFTGESESRLIDAPNRGGLGDLNQRRRFGEDYDGLMVSSSNTSHFSSAIKDTEGHLDIQTVAEEENAMMSKHVFNTFIPGVGLSSPTSTGIAAARESSRATRGPWNPQNQSDVNFSNSMNSISQSYHGIIDDSTAWGFSQGKNGFPSSFTESTTQNAFGAKGNSKSRKIKATVTTTEPPSYQGKEDGDSRNANPKNKRNRRDPTKRRIGQLKDSVISLDIDGNTVAASQETVSPLAATTISKRSTRQFKARSDRQKPVTSSEDRDPKSLDLSDLPKASQSMPVRGKEAQSERGRMSVREKSKKAEVRSRGPPQLIPGPPIAN